MPADTPGPALFPPALSSEARLVLLCAGGRANVPHVARLLQAPLDWSRVGVIAEREVMLPALWRRLAEYPSLPRGAPGVEALQQLAMVHEFRLLSRFDRLREGVRALRDAGIEVVLLKGTGLAISRYRAIGDRGMQDHDLLVRRGDAMRARDVLSTRGWFWTVEHDAEYRYRNHHHLPPLHRVGDDSSTVELHLGLVPGESPLRLSLDDLWATSERVSLGDVPVLVPSREHQLLHAALHYAYSHMFQRGAARLLSDLRVLLEEGKPDWDRFTSMAKESRAPSCCYWALWVGQQAGGLSVPESVMNALLPRRRWVGRSLAERHILSSMVGEGADCPSAFVQRSLWELAADPQGSGHGPARPWQFDPDKPDVPDGVGPRLSLRDRIGPWIRYLRLLSRAPARAR